MGAKEYLRRQVRSYQYVWVTFDPLYERVVCVHEKSESFCPKCKKIWNERVKEGSPYQLIANKFKIKP